MGTLSRLEGGGRVARHDRVGRGRGALLQFRARRSRIEERIASHLTHIEACGTASRRGRRACSATISSTAPFVGLFGTMGIMNSFIGISKREQRNLAVDHASMAEALLARRHRPCRTIQAIMCIGRTLDLRLRALIVDASAHVQRFVSATWIGSRTAARDQVRQ